MEIHEITEDQAESIRSLVEDHFHDRKSTRIRPASLSKTASASRMLTAVSCLSASKTTGSGMASKIPSPRMVTSRYSTNCFLSDPATGPTYLARTTNPAWYCMWRSLSRGKSSPRLTAFLVFAEERVMRRSTRLSGLNVLERNKGLVSHESTTVRQIPELITNSVTAIEFILGVVPTAEPEPWLRHASFLCLRSRQGADIPQPFVNTRTCDR